MHTIRLKKKTEADGALSLRIPLDQPNTEYEVVVIAQPCPSATPPEDRGWPPGYFDLAGSIDDDTFFRHPQGELPPPVELD